MLFLHQMTASPWIPLPWSPQAAWELLYVVSSSTTPTRGWVETTWQTCWPRWPTQRWWVPQWRTFIHQCSNSLLIIIIAISHDCSIKGPLVNNSDDFSSGRLKLFTFHGEREREREAEQVSGSWLGSQTAAIKSSGRGNVFLKLRAHILVVGHMQFLHMASTLAVCPSWWRNMFVMKQRSVSFPVSEDEDTKSWPSCPHTCGRTFPLLTVCYTDYSNHWIALVLYLVQGLCY